MRGLESPRALLAFLSIGLSWLAAGCEQSPSEPVRPKAPVPRIGFLTSLGLAVPASLRTRADLIIE